MKYLYLIDSQKINGIYIVSKKKENSINAVLFNFSRQPNMLRNISWIFHKNMKQHNIY